MAQFIKIANKNDIPLNEGRYFKVNGKEIAIFNVGGEFYATDHTCLHQGGPLAEGTLEGDVVTCPWHGWKFSVKTGVSPVVPTAKIGTYPVKLEKDDIMISV